MIAANPTIDRSAITSTTRITASSSGATSFAATSTSTGAGPSPQHHSGSVPSPTSSKSGLDYPSRASSAATLLALTIRQMQSAQVSWASLCWIANAGTLPTEASGPSRRLEFRLHHESKGCSAMTVLESRLPCARYPCRKMSHINAESVYSLSTKCEGSMEASKYGNE